MVPREPGQVAKKTSCFTLACQEAPAPCHPRAACSPTGVHTSCLSARDTGRQGGTHGTHGSHPLAGAKKEATEGLVSDNSGAKGCVREQEQAREEELRDPDLSAFPR